MLQFPRRVSIIAILIGLWLSGCQAPAPAPADSSTAAPTLSPAPAVSLADPLTACEVDAHAAAMRPGQVPDWESLGLATCYRMNLVLQPEQAAYTGTAQVTYTNRTNAALPDLVFRVYPNTSALYGGRLTISSARVNGEAVAPDVFLPDGTAVRLDLPAPLQPGETTEVTLHFAGQVPADFNDLPAVYGIFNYASAEQVLTLANWYPLLARRSGGDWQASPVADIGDAVVSDAALYRVQVSAPAGWQVVTTGTVISEEVTGDGVRQDIVSGPVRDFTVVASPNFVLREAGGEKGVVVRHWGLPGGEDRWEEALLATSDAVDLFDTRFGPYPYAELDAVAVPLENAAGVEYPGLFLILDTLYAPDEQRPFVLGIVVSHEVAHQWWYAVVGNDVLADPWQDEALAVFSSLVYQEVYQPEYHPGTLQFYGQVVAAAQAENPENMDVAQPVSAFESRRNLYTPVVYQRGGLFFEALRQRLGDEVFYTALRRYYAAAQYRLAPARQLLGAFEAACSCRLEDFYREWGVE